MSDDATGHVQVHPSLTFALVECEVNPPGYGDYLCLNVVAQASGFAGLTQCWVRTSAWSEWLKGLLAVAQTGVGAGELLSGWGDQVLLKVAVAPKVGLGSLRVQGELTGPHSSSAPFAQTLHFCFATEPTFVERFCRHALRMLDGNGSMEASLEGLSA